MTKTILFIFAGLTTAATFAQVPVKNVRPSFTNTVGPNQSGGVTFFPGLIARGENRPSSGTGVSAAYLSEAAYGQPFAVTETLSPSNFFAANVLSNPAKTGVYDVLYPAGYRSPTGVTATRAQLTARATGGAFRYKWLLYGQDGADAQGNPVVVNLFAETFGDVDDDKNPWFNDADRQLARDQIGVLRAALAHAPLNKELQLALLDIHHDLAVAEMQFVNKRLAKLATIRLGLDSAANTFVIDREIVLRRELVRVASQAASWYLDLLSFTGAGVDPGEFSSRFAGMPYGRFIFASRVPGRTQTETELGYASIAPRIFTAVNRVATITLPGDNDDFVITGEASVPASFRVVMSEGQNDPSFGGDTLSLPVTTAFTKISEIKAKLESPLPDGQKVDPTPFTITFSPGNDGSGTASTQSGAVQQIIALDPDGSSVFAGYKDYRTFLTILGQLAQYQVALADVLALRSSSGDLEEARQLLSKVKGPDTDTFLLAQNLFPDTNFDSTGLDSTGVRAALVLVRSALSEAVSVGSFVNGTSNALGLDKNFLLIVEKQGNETDFDSYDLLKNRIMANAGAGNSVFAVGALAVALEALGEPTRPKNGGGAIQAYDTFLSGFNEVKADLTALESEREDRFEAITGYPWNDGVNNWNGRTPNPTRPASELATAIRTAQSLEQRNDRLKLVLDSLDEDVNKASNLVSLADGLGDTIRGAQANYLAETESIRDGMSIEQGLAAGAQEAFDYASALAGGLNLAGLGLLTSASLINATLQAALAARVPLAEQELDEAAIIYGSTLTLADQALTAQQAVLDLGSLRREVLTTKAEIDSNSNALAQAVAERDELVREVDGLQSSFESQLARLASSYFADPIHFQRAEAALFNADAAFRRAQKWVFFTCRALEYKWQERFSYVNEQLGLADDISSIFKARNALELRRIYQSMNFFNDDRNVSPGSLRQDTATVSLRDRVLTPNPADKDKRFGAFPVDDGKRPDPKTGALVDKVVRFRDELRERATGPGSGAFNPPITIKIDSTQLEIGQLFAGPKFTFAANDPTRLTAIESGLYRSKIDWLAVHFVFKPGAIVKGTAVPAIPSNNGIDGSMSYGGTTWFRNRIPALPNRGSITLELLSDATISSTNINSPGRRLPRVDFPGEITENTFRYFQNTDPSTSIFENFPFKQAPSLEFIFSTQSAEVPAVENRITSTGGFQINDFKELSVATTELKLNIAANQFNLDDLNDIEIVVQHRAYTRPQIQVPAPQVPAP